MKLSRSAPKQSRTRMVWVSALAAASLALLSACSTIGGLFSGDKIDYRTTAAKTKPLEVPPDLTQLARDTRYQTQGGVVSAAGVAAAAPATTPAGTAAGTVAPGRLEDMRVERNGQYRWLVVPKTPEQLWPQVRGFWEKNGFTLASENAPAGVMETGWAENRAKLPNDSIRSTIGRLFGGLYDTGERDLYRTRIERTDGGSEIYISHRGLEEVYSDARHETTTWRPRASDPQLEAEMLARLMFALAGRDDAARAAPAVAAAAASQPGSPEVAGRARRLAGDAVGLEVDESFERAWRRVGLALDRGGFTVEDRDRAQGLYYVRYIDPSTAGQEEPSFFARLFSSAKGPQGPVRYRIALKANGAKTTLTVLTSAGAPEAGDNGKRIVTQLLNELR